MELDPKMQLALNEALSSRDQSIQRQLMALHGTQGLDAKRPKAWAEYGYPDQLTFNDFHKLYDRHGVAHGVVNVLAEKCWETNPWVIEGDEFDDKRPETPWERDLKRVLRNANVWDTMCRADVRRLVGHYAGVLLQLRDGAAWNQPVARSSRIELVKLVPAWEGQLRVKATDDDPNSETYGEPLMWTFDEAKVGSGSRSLDVHPDRIVILGDLRDGTPFLKAGYNSFINLEKVEGGSGESFLKNAARAIAINFDKDVDLANIARAHKVDMAGLQKIYDGVTRDLNRGIDATLITQGGSASPLSVAVSDPEPHYAIALQSACASVRIPSRIVVGNQSGERASTQDLAAFNSRGQGRRLKVLTPDIERLVRKFADVGVIKPIAEFAVIWDDLSEATQAEKLANAAIMADIVQKTAGSGDRAPFDSADIRDAAGLEAWAADEAPLTDTLPEGEE